MAILQKNMNFLQKAEAHIDKSEGHYVLMLPFRDSNIHLPNNKYQAITRANWQQFLRNEQYFGDYVTFINNVIGKGYAEKLLSQGKCGICLTT